MKHFNDLVQKIENQQLPQQTMEMIEKSLLEARTKGKAMVESFFKSTPADVQKKLTLQKDISDCLQKYDQFITNETTLLRDPAISVEVLTSFGWLVDLMASTLMYDTAITSAKIDQWLQNHPDFTGFKKFKYQLRKTSENILSLVTAAVVLPIIMQTVLGQYDLIFSGAKTNNKVLKFVQPNIERVVKLSGLKEEDLRLEVVVHEEIHGRQFFNYAYLDNERQRLVTNLLVAKEIGYLGGCQELTKGEASKIAEGSMDALQTQMCVVEGHAVFYTDKVLEKIMPHYFQYKNQRKAKSQQRREQLKRIKTLGKKLEQYELGEKFVQGVYSKVGIASSRLVLQELPLDTEELKNPELYLKRLKI